MASPIVAAPIPQTRPNIVLVNLDDADAEMMSLENMAAHYPCFSRLAQRATHFTNAHATTPFCGPSRVSLFTGKYAFNT
ncbi:MAG: sulfatase-like hydrolase/transferase, partial [Planctomycetota bacterium]